MKSLTYVFCLVRSTRRPAVTDAPATLPGAGEVRALQTGAGLWAIVATVAAREYDEAALARGLRDLNWVGERAMAHEAIVEFFLPARAVLPMQLFTLFTADDRVLQHVAGDRRRIDRIIARIERQLEWGLRLTFDEAGVRKAVETQPAPASGSAYLARKRDLRDVTRVQLAAAKVAADRLYRAMAREATDARRRTAVEHATSGPRLLLDAAFLVPVRRADAFRTALHRSTRTLSATGLSVSLTGPWPAYNFIQRQGSQARARKGSAT